MAAWHWTGRPESPENGLALKTNHAEFSGYFFKRVWIVESSSP